MYLKMEKCKFDEELQANGFFNIGYDTYQGGFRVLQYVHDTQGKVQKRLSFCVSFIVGTNRYICGYKYKKNLTKQDKVQLDEIENKFSEIVQKYGYSKLGKSIWNKKTKKLNYPRKMLKANKARLDDVAQKSDNYIIVNSFSTVTIFYFKDTDFVGIEINDNGRTEYYVSNDCDE